MAEGLPVAEQSKGGRVTKFDLSVAIPWYIERIRAELSGTSAAEAREALYKAQTEKTHLEIETRRRELIEIEESGRALMAVIGAYNGALRAIAPRAAAEIVDGMNQAEVQHVIEREIASARRVAAAEFQTWADHTDSALADSAAA